MEERVERRLAAILCADVVEYSRLMGADEEKTLAVLKSHRRELIDPLIDQHRGRIFKTTGDGILIEFASVVDAVRCAVVVQKGMEDRNTNLPERERIRFRIGINVAEHVAFVVDHVAEIDADAKADPLGLRPVGVSVRHSLLNHDGAAHGVDDRDELDQNAVAGGLEDAAAVLGDQRIDEFAPIAFENNEGSFLVRAHQPRIPGDVGAEDGR